MSKDHGYSDSKADRLESELAETKQLLKEAQQTIQKLRLQFTKTIDPEYRTKLAEALAENEKLKAEITKLKKVDGDIVTGSLKFEGKLVGTNFKTTDITQIANILDERDALKFKTHELTAEVERLKEYKAMYEGLCK